MKAKTTFSQGASGAVGLALPTAVAPQREGRRRPPPLKEIIRRMTPFCRKHGITRLEIFGSVARRAAKRGSDVDLIATFPEHPGLEIVAIEQACARLLGVPVHLLTRAAVDEMTNPYRKATIQRDRRTIYAA